MEISENFKAIYSNVTRNDYTAKHYNENDWNWRKSSKSSERNREKEQRYETDQWALGERCIMRRWPTMMVWEMRQREMKLCQHVSEELNEIISKLKFAFKTEQPTIRRRAPSQWLWKAETLSEIDYPNNGNQMGIAL